MTAPGAKDSATILALTSSLIAAMDYFSQDPVVYTWNFNLDKAA